MDTKTLAQQVKGVLDNTVWRCDRTQATYHFSALPHQQWHNLWVRKGALLLQYYYHLEDTKQPGIVDLVLEQDSAQPKRFSMLRVHQHMILVTPPSQHDICLSHVATRAPGDFLYHA